MCCIYELSTGNQGIRIRIAIFACGFVVDSSSQRLTVDLQVATVLLGAAGEHQVVGGLDLEVLPLVLVLQETRGGGVLGWE